MLSSKHHSEDSDVSVSSLSDDKPTPTGQMSGRSEHVTHRGDSRPDPHADPRLSPGSLERRMAAELHLLEGMDQSLQQLTNVERTRAVALAQQETVSLAQILKVSDNS